MAIRRIYIQDRNKNNIKTISGSMMIRAAESAVGRGVERSHSPVLGILICIKWPMTASQQHR